MTRPASDVPPDGTPRPALRIDQAGDPSFGTVAGGDINYGLNPAEALQLVRDVWRFDQKLDILRNEAMYYQELEADRWRVQVAANTAMRQWIAALTLVLFAIVGIVAVLVWREAATLAARAAFDVALTRR